MFFLKFLFITFLVILIILLLWTIYNKIKNPEKPFLRCIPYMDDFSQANNTTTVVSEKITVKPVIASDNTIKTDSGSKKEVAGTKDVKKPAKSITVESSTTSAKKSEAVKKKTADTAPSKKITDTAKPTAQKKNATKAKTAAPKKKSPTKIGDNIKKVNGIGPVFEKRLNSIGINTFKQIAAWSEADANRIDEELEFSGRPQREEWVAKAKILAAEKE